jgi:hypothetical protein
MRESFRKKLELFRDIIKTPVKTDIVTEDTKEIVSDWAVKTSAEKTSTPVETQKKIFEFQRKKQDIMDDLKEELKLLDRGEYESIYGPAGSIVSKKEGKLFAGSTEITLGKLMSDIDWKILHRIDGSVPREIHKKYLVERAKHRIGTVLDEQIIEEEKVSKKNDGSKQAAYEALSIEHTEERDRQSGFIAERMVKSLLKKISFDIPNAGFDIVETDAEYDVNRKIDFLLVKKNHERGIEVEAKEVQGIQFTINVAKGVAEHKTAQIQRVKDRVLSDENDNYIKDIVLVTAPLHDIKEKYNRWSRGKNSGGPDEYWSVDKKIKIIENVLKDFLDQQSIDGITKFITAKEGSDFKY